MSERYKKTAQSTNIRPVNLCSQRGIVNSMHLEAIWIISVRGSEHSCHENCLFYRGAFWNTRTHLNANNPYKNMCIFKINFEIIMSSIVLHYDSFGYCNWSISIMNCEGTVCGSWYTFIAYHRVYVYYYMRYLFHFMCLENTL